VGGAAACALTPKPPRQAASVWAYNRHYREELPLAVAALLAEAARASEAGEAARAVALNTRALRSVEASSFSGSSVATCLAALALAQEAAGLRADARTSYERIVALSSGLPQAVGMTAAVGAGTGPALASGVNGPLRTASQWRFIAFERLAQLAQEDGDLVDAQALYLRALENLVGDPKLLDKVWAQDARGERHGSSGSAPLSSRSAKEAAALLNNLGTLYVSMGSPSAAQAVFRRCLALVRVCVDERELERDAAFKASLAAVEEQVLALESASQVHQEGQQQGRQEDQQQALPTTSNSHFR
jgi:hypothetical protein